MGATVPNGTAGYGRHLNAIPIGSGFEDRHSDKIKVLNFYFRMQFRDSQQGQGSFSVHNVYAYLVRDNSGGTVVPTFDKVCLMDNQNVATAVVDHDVKDRFIIVKRWKMTFSGACKNGNTYYQPYRDRIDFTKYIKINQESNRWILCKYPEECLGVVFSWSKL